MQTAVKKAIKFGRATVVAIGLGIVLALVLGLATAALAAVPGDPLRLGQVNEIREATTFLQGTIDGGPMLSISNGSDVGMARALEIGVAAGQPPLTVNNNSGTATGLSADKLHGKDSTAYANATNGKANDSDKLDGKDSQAFYSGRAYKVKGSEGVVGTDNGQIKFRQARCDSGDALLAGGYDVDAGDIVFFSEPDLVSFADSGPGWIINVQDNGLGNLMSATALCADFPPFHQ